MNIILMVLYPMLIVALVRVWFLDLTNHKFYWKPTVKDHTKWYILSIWWWTAFVSTTFLMSFFLFCGMFILPLVMGAW